MASVYNLGASKVLDWTALAGTANVYNKATGAIAGVIYKRQKRRVILLSLPRSTMSPKMAESVIPQLGGSSRITQGAASNSNCYGGDQFGVALDTDMANAERTNVKERVSRPISNTIILAGQKYGTT